ncbi:MAG: RNA-binding protein [Halodesulfurarchaeum sp.]
MGLPFHYVDLRAFCYATEDEDRVRGALRTLLPPEAEIQSTVGEGHHGDRIAVLSARVDRAAEIEAIFDELREHLDFAALRRELSDRLDDNNALYLTLDKQAAARGEITRGDGITLRAKVEAYPAEREAALENAREALS